MHTEFWYEYLLKNNHLEDREEEARKTIIWILRELVYEDGRLMQLAQDRVQWRASVLVVFEP
jgi:uncharacterized tellurite resistance protein B-like protein